MIKHEKIPTIMGGGCPEYNKLEGDFYKILIEEAKEEGRKQALEEELKFLDEILNMFLLGFDKDIKRILEKKIAQIKKELENEKLRTAN